MKNENRKALQQKFKNSKKPKKLGKSIDLDELVHTFVIPALVQKKRRPSTILNLKKDISRFQLWWSTISKKPLPISKIRRCHLEAFRAYLEKEGGSVTLQNYAIRSIAQALNAATRHEFIPRAPKLEALEYNKFTPRIYPNNTEFEKLWDSCSAATWPRKALKGSALPYSPELGWKCALLLYRLYGFRTQELIRLESSYRSLHWGNIYKSGMTPNPEGSLNSPLGWLSYVPQKQERMKPQPLTVPLTLHAKAAINILKRDKKEGTNWVFDWPLSSINFYKAWGQIRAKAQIKPRPESGEKEYNIKHLRKAATTEINIHRPGIAPYIVGHSADRTLSGSEVSDHHYNNPEQSVYECMKTLPVPDCFDEIFDHL